MKQCQVWTIANQKGGVGKTTTTVSLAGLLAEQAYKVLLIDLDPHASLSHYFTADARVNHSIFEVLIAQYPQQRLPELIQKTTFTNIDIVSGSMNLATLDGQYGQMQGMGLQLTNGIKAVVDEYDYVLIDCPPMLGVLMINALAACQHVVIPVQVEHLALQGLTKMMQSLTMLETKLHKALPSTILPTMFDKRLKASARAYQTLREEYPKNLWKGVIPVDTQFREASSQLTPINIAYPKAKGNKAYTMALMHIQHQCRPGKIRKLPNHKNTQPIDDFSNDQGALHA
ncbi:ParA family protein [Opacimonas viscosa]|uniref:ParA family protein n=1 Tax=Opacimonas viscosa TaxID=2961944 RepID=A0AA41WXG6_9ALTE|nr:ParA family protein [Opacimonas viscosa]MCP3427845.1 ParA family protein [Opacimonas viscosa]